ncbi:MAG TPA: hypothetical protein VL282_09880 [Tepidisphaeraceae bacterium]|nr:hypothetical protein [Tepidisphaeraceae bacterium]
MLMISVLNGLLILAGLVCGIIAIVGVIRTRRKGVLAPAIVGFLLNSVLIVVIVSSLMFVMGIARNRANSAQSAQAQTAKAQKVGMDAFMSSGWYGVAQLPNGGLVCFTEVPDDSALVADMKKNLAHPCYMAILSIRNPAGGSELSIEPADIIMQLDSGKTIRPINRREISDAKTERQAIEHFLGTRSISAGTDLNDGIVCVSPDTQMDHLRAVTVPLSTGDVTVVGRVYTADEKKALFEKGEKLKTQQSDQQLRLQ